MTPESPGGDAVPPVERTAAGHPGLPRSVRLPKSFSTGRRAFGILKRSRDRIGKNRAGDLKEVSRTYAPIPPSGPPSAFDAPAVRFRNGVPPVCVGPGFVRYSHCVPVSSHMAPSLSGTKDVPRITGGPARGRAVPPACKGR